MKFYVCDLCGKVITMMDERKTPTVCCNEKMKELKPGTVDAAVEKHVPVVEMDGKKVVIYIGEAEHPMLDEHYIEWIVAETKSGWMAKWLKPGDKPRAVFMLDEEDEFVAAYEYCNLHGLWVSEA